MLTARSPIAGRYPQGPLSPKENTNAIYKQPA